MDGCINNVGGSHIALPLDRQANPEQITATALNECQKINVLVRKTKDDFKEATIILVNYFQVVSTRSSMTDLIGLTPIAGPMDILARACDKVTSHIGLGTPCTHKRWEKNSTAFLSAVTSCFDWTAAVQNGLRDPSTGQLVAAPSQPCEIAGTTNPRLVSKVGADSRVYVATVENKPEFAYGAPKSHLWLMPGLFLHHDDMYEIRKGICYATFDKDPNKKSVCRAELRNPIAHPNVLGAIAYADKIVELLDAAWVQSPTVSSPTP